MAFRSVSKMLKLVVLAFLLAFPAILVHCDTCGTRTVLRRPLVSYGKSSYPGQWPWHAALFQGKNGLGFEYACGSSIVSSSYVITAAVCTYTYRPNLRPLTISEIQVRTGITNIQGGEHSLQQRSILKIERHENYSTSSTKRDIALLKLEEELEITDFVRPICLWEGSDAEDLIVGKDGYVAGWGLDENYTLPNLLRHAVMPIVSRKVCRNSDPYFYPHNLFNRQTFCAGYRNRTSASNGDSGGGLFIEVNGTWMLRGIVSNGKLDDTGSLDTTSFIVFTDVAYFNNWIRNKMKLSNERSTITTIDDKYAACGNKLRPSNSQNKNIDCREEPWFGAVRSVDTPSVNLCEVAIISTFYVLAPANRTTDQYFDNPSLIEVVFARDNGEILSTHRIRRSLRHDNSTSIVLLELTKKLSFNYLFQPICIGIFSENSWEKEINQGECESSIRAANPHAYCYQEKKSEHGFDLKNRNGKTFLRGVVYKKYYSNKKFENISIIANISYYADWIRRKSERPSKLFALEECPKDQTFRSYVHITISDEPGYLCYGSMITKSLIITVATCVTGKPLESMNAVMYAQGSLKLKAIHIHPSFEIGICTNNIAIVELTEPELQARPFCYPKYKENLSRIDLYNPFLKKMIIAEGSNFCGNFNTIMFADNYDCTVNFNGFPVFYKYPGSNNRYLRGILNHNSEHCEKDYLSVVFIDLMFYADWIKEIAAKTRQAGI